jgi:hypothetical protein
MLQKFLPMKWGHDGAILLVLFAFSILIIFFISGLCLMVHSINRNQSLRGLTWAFWVSTSPFWGFLLVNLVKEIIRQI